MGQLANQGQSVYSQDCARCHGDKGQGAGGPPLVGAGSSLQKYGTAAGLLGFVSKAMPKTRPGGLSAEQYQQLLGFLLVQNGFSSADVPFDASRLDGIALKK